MSKHLEEVNVITAVANTASRRRDRRRVIWLGTCVVVVLFYAADMSHVLMLGVIFDHVAELIIGTGVSRFIER